LDKDLVVAVLGAAIGLAGLLLVFAGFLFAQSESFPSTVSDSASARYRRAAKIGVAPFLGCLALAVVAGYWLKSPSPELLHVVWMGFRGLVVVTGLYGAYALLYELGRDS
jgi:hypothetical protein